MVNKIKKGYIYLLNLLYRDNTLFLTPSSGSVNKDLALLTSRPPKFLKFPL